MTTENINEKLTDEQLEQVAGGTRIETSDDAYELVKRGIFKGDDVFGVGEKMFSVVREKLHEFGYTGYQCGYNEDNIYTDKNGNKISRETFWANFDKENGTKIILV